MTNEGDSPRLFDELQKRITDWVDALAAAQNDCAVAEVWNAIPASLKKSFLAAAERHADALHAAGDADTATRVRGSIGALRETRQRRIDLDSQPPMVRALLAFLQAEDDAAARRLQRRRGGSSSCATIGSTHPARARPN